MTQRWQPTGFGDAASTVTLRDGVVRYRLEGPGAGPSVVLVHGLTYPLEVWGPLAAHLSARGYRVCRYDLWGRGGSALPHGPLTVPRLAKQLTELIDAVLPSGPAALVSLSNSDLIVTQLAREAPARVRGLVMLAPSMVDPRTMSGWARLLQALPVPSALAHARLRRTLVERISGHRQRLPADASAQVKGVYEYASRCVQESPVFAQAVQAQLRGMPSEREVTQSLRRLQATNVRAAAISFADERDVTGAAAALLTQHWPDCQRAQLPGTHMGLLERPAEVNAAVEQALARF